MTDDRPLRALDVAYVVQRYPKVSHVFIQREVQELRRAGASVQTYSLRRAGPEDVLSNADEQEARSTVALRPVPVGRLLQIHATWLVRASRAYLRTLATALHASSGGARAALWQVFYFVQAIALHDELRRRSARHVHAHLANVAVDVTWLATTFGDAAGTGPWRWSFTMHGPTEFRDVVRFNLARKVENADVVVCISDFCRSQLMALVAPEHWEKLVVVHCGVDTERFRTVERPPRVPQRILTVGRLVPEKAQSLLLDAVARLVELGHDVVATIVGDGPDHDRLVVLRDELRLTKRVTFSGAVGQDDLVGMFEDADLFVLPSFDEGVPVVLMEAMACGLPVITTRIAGIPELVADDVSGVLVPPGRVDLLVDAISRLLEDPARRARIGRQARVAVEGGFDAHVEAIKLGRAVLQLWERERVNELDRPLCVA
jgi:colanic acid/amylovoran biosynthesis glycosyltransferase